jgi:hypothetical protein
MSPKTSLVVTAVMTAFPSFTMKRYFPPFLSTTALPLTAVRGVFSPVPT